MDIFVEHLVKKKRTGKDFVKILACLVGVLIILMFLPVVLMIKLVGPIAFTACIGLIYLLYRLITATNLEYEYCFTNGALDVDKVINMRSRKRLLEVNARKIDMMASNKNREFKRYLDDRTTKKVYACTHIDDEGVYFVIFPGKNGRTMLLFNPNDKIKEGFRRYNPQKVTLDD